MARKKRAADSDESAPRKAKVTTNTTETTKPSDATTLRTTRSMKRKSTESARQAVLQTDELLDAILVNLPMKQLFVAQRVCKRFKAVIAATPAIQEKMLLRSKKEEDLEVWTMLRPERKCTPLAFNPMLFVSDQSDWYKAMRSGEAIDSWLHDPTILGDQTHKGFLNTYITNPPCWEAIVSLFADYRSHSSRDRAHLDYGAWDPIHVELEHGLTFKDLLDAAMNERASSRGSAGWHKRGASVDLDLDNKTIGQVVDRLEGHFGRAVFVHFHVKVPNAITPGLEDWAKVRAGSWEGVVSNKST